MQNKIGRKNVQFVEKVGVSFSFILLFLIDNFNNAKLNET